MSKLQEFKASIAKAERALAKLLRRLKRLEERTMEQKIIVELSSYQLAVVVVALNKHIVQLRRGIQQSKNKAEKVMAVMELEDLASRLQSTWTANKEAAR